MNRYAAILQICDAVVESIKAAGAMGAPSGVIYASLMQFGCNLSQYESLIGILVKAGKIRKQGDLLFAIWAMFLPEHQPQPERQKWI